MRPEVRSEGPFEDLTETQIDKYQDRWGYHENTYHRFYRVNRGYHRQSAAKRSDRFHPTQYYRERVETISEKPYSYTARNWSGSEWRGDNTHEQYISNRITYVAYWYPSGRYGTRLSNASARSRTLAREGLAQKNQLQLGANLAEARQTGELLAGSASTLWQSLLAFKRGQWGKIPDLLGLNTRDVLSGRFAANNWLRYQYGWRPLMGDIYTTWERATQEVQKPLYVYSEKTSPVEVEIDYVSNGFNVKQKDKGGSSVKLCATPNSDFFRDMNGFGLANPAYVAWEVVPFSFVIDWGIPVSNFLNSLTSVMGLDFVWGYESIKTESTWQLEWAEKGNPYFVVHSPGNLEWRRIEFSREPMRGFPLPQLYGNENPFSTPRILSALALARQLFSGRP